jgi:hypothetical protein
MNTDRLVPEGVPRGQLKWALGQKNIVEVAIKVDRCLLCRAEGVNPAGLCEVCVTYLTPDELALVELWRSGVLPE